jgi:hypothetical protein
MHEALDTTAKRPFVLVSIPHLYRVSNRYNHPIQMRASICTGDIAGTNASSHVRCLPPSAPFPSSLPSIPFISFSYFHFIFPLLNHIFHITHYSIIKNQSQKSHECIHIMYTITRITDLQESQIIHNHIDHKQ